MLFLLGIPLFFIELAIGQRLRKGSVLAWNSFHPYLGGVGGASAIMAFFIGVYFTTIIAWCFWYICNSFVVSDC